MPVGRKPPISIRVDVGHTKTPHEWGFLILRNIHDAIEMLFTVSNLPNYDFYFHPTFFPLYRPILNWKIFTLINPI